MQVVLGCFLFVSGHCGVSIQISIVGKVDKMTKTFAGEPKKGVEKGVEEKEKCLYKCL